MFGAIGDDLRHAMRSLRRHPGYALTAALTLAIGIGASTAIFSLVHAIVLRPLPFRRPEQLVWVSSTRTSAGDFPFTLPDFIDYRDQNHTLEGIAAFANWSATLTGRGDPERLSGLRISANAFELLGVHAIAGRVLKPADDTPGLEHVVLLGFALWHRRFGADSLVVGKPIELNGAAYTVVGVLPPQFPFPIREAELAVPLAPEADPWRNVRTSTNFLRALGRVRDHVSREQAQADLTVIAQRLRAEFPQAEGKKLGVTLTPLQDRMIGNSRFALWVLLGAVGVLLLISCVNLAGLTLVRASARQQEFAIRMALGATGRRLVQQLATESLLLAAVGGSAGLALAGWGIRVLLFMSPQALPRTAEVGLDMPVLGFALATSLAAVLIFGLAPAWRATRVDLDEQLRQEGRGSSGGMARHRARRGLVVCEIALSVVLLIGAGLLVRSLLVVQAVRPGFESDHVLVARLSLSRARHPDRAALHTFHEALHERLARVPGVESVGFVSILPLSGLLSTVEFSIDGRESPKDASRSTSYRVVGRDYFRTMRIPLISGRGFDERDRSETSPVVLISQEFARRYWPSGGSPVGSHLRIDDNDVGPRPVEIVGVVGDVKDAGLDADPTPQLYLPVDQVPEDAVVWLTRNQYWLVRTRVDPLTVLASVRRGIQAVDPEAPTTSIQSMDQYLSDSVAPRRFSFRLLGVFSAVALVLAAMGLYGTTSYGVAQRRREIGIRIALGAQSGDVLRLVIMQGMRLAAVGAGIGILAALVVTRLMSSLLFGVSRTDPVTYIGIAGLQMLVALLACYVPARRAARLDPLAALR